MTDAGGRLYVLGVNLSWRHGRPPSAPLAPATLRINGSDHQNTLDARTLLLDALREHLALAGSKKGCARGQCGACTVHVDGRATLACRTLAIAARDKQIVTIEG